MTSNPSEGTPNATQAIGNAVRDIGIVHEWQFWTCDLSFSEAGRAVGGVRELSRPRAFSVPTKFRTMDTDSQEATEETIFTGEDLMSGPPSPVVPPELAPQILDGVELCASHLRKLFECECELHSTARPFHGSVLSHALSDSMLLSYVL